MKDLVPRIELPFFSVLSGTLLFVFFIGLSIWVFQGRRKRFYENAAKLPLDDASSVENHTKTGSNNG